jgi:hypothetical protein
MSMARAGVVHLCVWVAPDGHALDRDEILGHSHDADGGHSHDDHDHDESDHPTDSSSGEPQASSEESAASPSEGSPA